MKELERRHTAMTEMRVEWRSENSPRIIGHAAVFNQLSDNLGGFRERIKPGAFLDSISSDDIRGLFNHDKNLVLGRNKAGTLALSEDDQGLHFEITPPDTQLGRDLVVSIERGDITGNSIGFKVLPDGQKWEEDGDGLIIRTLSRIKLFDVGPVTYPAYPQTDVAVRSLAEWNEQRDTQRAETVALDHSLRLKMLDLAELT